MGDEFDSNQQQEPKPITIPELKRLAAFEMIELNSKLRRNAMLALIGIFIVVIAGFFSIMVSFIIAFGFVGFFLLQSYSHTSRINMLSQKYKIEVKPGIIEKISKNLQNNMQERQRPDDQF